MHIAQVCENLRTTIAGKEQMLALYKEKLDVGNYFKKEIKVNQTAEKTTVKFLEININELKCILKDLEKCMPIQQSNPYKRADDGFYGKEYQGQ